MTTEKKGICFTCAHSPKCALKPARRASNGVQFCEEYETVHMAPAAALNEEVSRNIIPKSPPGILGLCSNCDRYAECTFPKPEAGVWHCEDYL